MDWIKKKSLVSSAFARHTNSVIWPVFFLLFLSGGIILPLTTKAMIGDFKACGGFLMIATGFRIMKLRQFPTADMIPAMILVMPISWAWVNWVVPLIS